MNYIELKIPKIRIGAIIGKDGQTKKELEDISDSKIEINSNTGDIEISTEKANPITFYRLELVIKAIGRGFNPEKAKNLFDENYTLNVINLKDLSIKNKKTTYTRKSRVIGTDGSIRKYLEDNLDCYISIQGKTISIVGNLKNIKVANEVIMRLLKGATIGAIKTTIEKYKKNSDDFNFNDLNEYNEFMEKENTEKDILN